MLRRSRRDAGQAADGLEREVRWAVLVRDVDDHHASIDDRFAGPLERERSLAYAGRAAEHVQAARLPPVQHPVQGRQA